MRREIQIIFKEELQRQLLEVSTFSFSQAYLLFFSILLPKQVVAIDFFALVLLIFKRVISLGFPIS